VQNVYCGLLRAGVREFLAREGSGDARITSSAVRKFRAFRVSSQSEGAGVFAVKNVGCTLGRQLLALGSVLLGFDQVKVKLFDEIENSLRIAIVLFADRALDWFFAISLHLVSASLFSYYAVRVGKPNRENGWYKQTS